MKRILFILALAVMAGGCTNNSERASENLINTTLREVEFDGHKYLQSSSGGIIHSESCPCHNQVTQTLSEWDKMILAISYTESKFKTDAVGKSQDYGCLQITPTYCAEVNRISGANFKHEDAFDIESSLAMFDTMQSHYNPDHDIDTAIHFHNKSASYKRVVLENLELIKRYETFRAKLIEK